MDISTKLNLIKYIVNKDFENIYNIFYNNKLNNLEIVEFLQYNKMDLFLFDLIKNNVYIKDKYKELMKIMDLEFELFIYRKKMHKKAYQLLYDRFEQNSVRYMVLKGFGLDFSIFKERTVRKYSDIDFLVCPSDLDKVTEICISLGYIQGEYNSEKKQIKPYSRKEKINKRLYSHELAQFVQVMEDGFVSNIDINFKFSWTGYKKSYESLVEFDTAFEHSEEIYEDGIKIRVMNVYFNCIHLCCHFFNSCVNFLMDYEYIIGTDPREFDFSGINDIFEVIKKKNFNFSYLKRLVKKYGVQEQVDYAFHLITVFFGMDIPHFCYDTDINSLEKLNYYISRTGNKKFWKIPFLTRICDKEKKETYIRTIGFEE